MTLSHRAPREQPIPLVFGTTGFKPMASDGRVGGFQAHSWYCAEEGCDFVFISVIRKNQRALCPKHSKRSH